MGYLDDYTAGKLSGELHDGISLLGTCAPFLENPGKFSGPKSHFKNHEALDVQRFLFQHVLHLNKAYTYATFRIQESFCFSAAGF